MPLIWCNLQDLIKYNSVFFELKKNKIIEEFMIFSQLTDGNKFYSFELNPINVILEKYADHYKIQI